MKIIDSNAPKQGNVVPLVFGEGKACNRLVVTNSFFIMHRRPGHQFSNVARCAPLSKVWAVLVLLLLLLGALLGSEVPEAEAAFLKGVSARAQGDLTLAITRFQRATDLDSTMTKAHLELGAIAEMICRSQTNVDHGITDIATKAYRRVLELDPQNRTVSKGLAFVLYSTGQREESEIYYRESATRSGLDPESVCGYAAAVGHLAWIDTTRSKEAAGVQDDASFINSNSCGDVRSRNVRRIEDAIDLSIKAHKIQPNLVDLIGFLSFLYGDRARIQCGNEQAFRADRQAAKKWSRRAVALTKRKASSPNSFPGPVVLPRCPPAPPPLP